MAIEQKNPPTTAESAPAMPAVAGRRATRSAKRRQAHRRTPDGGTGIEGGDQHRGAGSSRFLDRDAEVERAAHEVVGRAQVQDEATPPVGMLREEAALLHEIRERCRGDLASARTKLDETASTVSEEPARPNETRRVRLASESGDHERAANPRARVRRALPRQSSAWDRVNHTCPGERVMKARTYRHVCATIHRALSGFALAALPRPAARRRRASAVPVEANRARARTDSPPSADGSPPASASSSADGGARDGWPCAYSWMSDPRAQVLASTCCRPDVRTTVQTLDPTTWDPHHVGLDLWTATPPNDAGVQMELSRAAPATRRRSICGTDHGWYYVPSAGGGRKPRRTALARRAATSSRTMARLPTDGGRMCGFH